MWMGLINNETLKWKEEKYHTNITTLYKYTHSVLIHCYHWCNSCNHGNRVSGQNSYSCNHGNRVSEQNMCNHGNRASDLSNP